VTVGAGQTVTRTFQVTVPAGAQPGTSTLTARVSSPGGPGGGGTSLVEASTTIAVAAPSLSAAYNNTGISNNSGESAADYDGVGDSFSAQALAAGTPAALTQGQGHGGRDHVHLARRGGGRQRDRGRPDHRRVRVRHADQLSPAS
jgi:hypothetical protein